MDTIKLGSQKFYSSFDILYPWYNDTTVVKYKYTNFKFFVRKIEESFEIWPLNKTKKFIFRKNGRRVYITLHRRVVEIVMGKPIQKNMEVHHIDHNHNNNLPENLIVVSHKDHLYLHKILKDGVTDFVNGKGSQKLDFYVKVVKTKKNF